MIWVVNRPHQRRDGGRMPYASTVCRRLSRPIMLEREEGCGYRAIKLAAHELQPTN